MKVIIAGGRNYQFTADDQRKLDQLHSEWKITEVVSGGARGADRCGEFWANRHGIPIKVFRANWNQYGNAAGPIRNGEMAEYADAVVLFPGGRGTADMLNQAEGAGLTIVDWRSDFDEGDAPPTATGLEPTRGG